MRNILEAVADLIRFYEGLSPGNLGEISRLYAPGASFKDPFNEVCGVGAIERIFRHMYTQVHEPRFSVVSHLADEGEAWLAWEFRFRFRGWKSGEVQCVRGATHLRFSPDGQVLVHRDYWDSGEELFVKLPVLGLLVAWLRRRLAAS